MSKDLIDILTSPSITVLLGKRREGKTSTGMKVLEEAHERGMKTYAVGIPEKKWHLLPDYIVKTKSLDDVDDGAAVFIDEAYLMAFARDSSKKSNKTIAKILGIASQKEWTLVFATHYSRKLEFSILADCDNQFFKRQTKLLVKFERGEIKDMVNKAYAFFQGKKKQGENTKQWGIIFSEDNLPDGPLGVKYNLPTFWNDDISKAFSGLKMNEI